MKIIVKLGAALVLFVVASSVLAQIEVVDKRSFNVTYTASINDKYLLKYSSVVYDSRPSWQADLGISFLNGLYADVWFARHFGAVRNDIDGNEVDFIVGWATELGGLSVDSSLAYYDLVPLFNGSAGNVWAPAVKVSKTFTPAGVEVSPFVRVEVAIPDKGSGFSGGSLSTVGVDLKGAMSDRFGYTLSHFYTYDSGCYDLEENVILGLAGSFDWKVKVLTVTFPSFLLTQPLRDKADREFETNFGASIKWSF